MLNYNGYCCDKKFSKKYGLKDTALFGGAKHYFLRNELVDLKYGQ